MSLLALLASSSRTTTPPPDPEPDTPPTVPTSTLHSTDRMVIDWGQAQTLTVAPLGHDSVREQDDIVYDPGHPDPNRRWCFYFSAMIGAVSRIWVMHSPDGIEWTNPVFCFHGQDPSITQTWEPNPVAYRDSSGQLVMFCENNATDEVDAYTSTDGIAWTLVKSSAIPRAAGTTGWDHALTGSPNARHDGAQFIVGYEGIQTSPTRIETFSIAWGATPSTLVKSPNTPIVDPTTIGGYSLKSIVSDALYLHPDGTRAFLAAHDGIVGSSAGSMWRMTTTKTDPTTWQPGDFTMAGSMADPSWRGDFTLDAYRGRAVTSTPGLQSMVTAPLVAAP